MEENMKSGVLQSMGIVFEKSKNCNPMKMLEYGGHFETLYARGILQQQGAYPTAGLPSSCESIMFNNMVVLAVVNNKPIPEAPQYEQDNLIGLLEKFYLLGLQRSEKEISTYFLLQKAQDLLHSNLHYPLIKKIRHMENPDRPTRQVSCRNQAS